MSQHEKEKNFSERLSEEIEYDGSNKSQIAKDIGISAVSMSRYLNDRIPNTKILNDLSSRLNLNSSWLLTGKGDKRPLGSTKMNDTEAAYITDAPKQTLDSIEQQWRLTIADFAKNLNAEQVLDLIESIYKSKPYGWETIDQGLRALIRKKIK